MFLHSGRPFYVIFCLSKYFIVCSWVFVLTTRINIICSKFTLFFLLPIFFFSFFSFSGEGGGYDLILGGGRWGGGGGAQPPPPVTSGLLFSSMKKSRKIQLQYQVIKGVIIKRYEVHIQYIK